MEQKITEPQKADFLHYVMDFYGPESDLYPIEGLTLEVADKATDIHLARCGNDSEDDAHIVWGDGDSVDRECVRDIINDILRTKEGLIA